MNRREGEERIFIYYSESYPTSSSPLQEHQLHLKCLQSITKIGASLLACVREGAANRLNSDGVEVQKPR